MRAIDGDALIEVINRHCYPVQHDMTSIEPGMTRIGILQAIHEQPTVQPERWIPVTEKLPEDGERVLVTVKNGEILFGSHLGKYWAFGSKVVAWMPLPAPYREEGEE